MRSRPPARRSSRRAGVIELSVDDIATIRATQGPTPVTPEPYAPAAGAVSASARRRFEPLELLGGARRYGAWRRSSTTAARASGHGMGVWKAPDDEALEIGKRMAVFRSVAPLPAADVSGLAVLGVHDGPRAHEGGGLDPGLDCRRNGHHGASNALFV